MADLAKIFAQARALRMGELPTGELPRGEAAARYAKEHGVTLCAAGRLFGISRERVRQIEAKALRKMRHPTRAKQLQAFLDLLEGE